MGPHMAHARRRIPRVVLGLPAGDHPAAELSCVVETAAQAEAAGFGGVILAEHVVVGQRTSRYPWGKYPFPPEAPWPEPLTVLAAISSVTTQLMLSTGILIAPLRPAAVLAKTAATLDRLSGGRLVLGVGTGWQAEEFAACGVDFERRGPLLTDTIAACRALWADGTTGVLGNGTAESQVWCEPKPVRPGGPLVLFSGTLTRRNVDRIVTLGDGWIPIMGETTAGIATGVDRLRAALAAAGRDPDQLVVRAPLPLGRRGDGRPDLRLTVQRATGLLDAGVNELSVYLGMFGDCPSDVSEALEDGGEALVDAGLAARGAEIGARQWSG